MPNISPELLAKAEDHFLQTEASKRAIADPLPGPLATAFGPQNIKVDEYLVRPLVANDWAIMKQIDSPIYRQMLEIMQEGEKAKDIEPEPQETWELIYLLTRPCKEADKVFQQGKQVFAAAAKEEFGMREGMHLGKIAALNTACFKQIRAHMETMVRYAQEQQEENVGNGVKDGPLDFLPNTGHRPVTDSAGG